MEQMKSAYRSGTTKNIINPWKNNNNTSHTDFVPNRKVRCYIGSNLKKKLRTEHFIQFTRKLYIKAKKERKRPKRLGR